MATGCRAEGRPGEPVMIRSAGRRQFARCAPSPARDEGSHGPRGHHRLWDSAESPFLATGGGPTLPASIVCRPITNGPMLTQGAGSTAKLWTRGTGEWEKLAWGTARTWVPRENDGSRGIFDSAG